eukprot:2831360-Rhodomonas_salina.1
MGSASNRDRRSGVSGTATTTREHVSEKLKHEAEASIELRAKAAACAAKMSDHAAKTSDQTRLLALRSEGTAAGAENVKAKSNAEHVRGSARQGSLL